MRVRTTHAGLRPAGGVPRPSLAEHLVERGAFEVQGDERELLVVELLDEIGRRIEGGEEGVRLRALADEVGPATGSASSRTGGPGSARWRSPVDRGASPAGPRSPRSGRGRRSGRRRRRHRPRSSGGHWSTPRRGVRSRSFRARRRAPARRHRAGRSGEPSVVVSLVMPRSYGTGGGAGYAPVMRRRTGSAVRGLSRWSSSSSRGLRLPARGGFPGSGGPDRAGGRALLGPPSVVIPGAVDDGGERVQGPRWQYGDNLSTMTTHGLPRTVPDRVWVIWFDLEGRVLVETSDRVRDVLRRVVHRSGRSGDLHAVGPAPRTMTRGSVGSVVLPKTGERRGRSPVVDPGCRPWSVRPRRPSSRPSPSRRRACRRT